jgi:hypothetical protein
VNARRCDRAASLGTCTADTGVACGGPDAINCNALASGFVSGNICQRFADNTTGLCDNTGTCIKTDTQRCIDNAVPLTGLFTCGDAVCVDAGTCVSRTAVPTSLDAVCALNEDRAACPAIECDDYVRGWANSVDCQRYGASPRTGRCNAAGACFSATAPSVLTTLCATPNVMVSCLNAACVRSTACQANTLIGTSDTLAKVCTLNANTPGCTNIDCTTTVAGWSTTGANCERYNMQHDGFCNALADCETSIAQCKSAPNVARATSVACPSRECRDLTKCVPDTSVAQSDAQNEVCLLGVPSGACSGYTCTDKLAGVSGAQCLKFTVQGTGFCNAGGNCETTCQGAFNQVTAVHQQCGSAQCVRPGVLRSQRAEHDDHPRRLKGRQGHVLLHGRAAGRLPVRSGLRRQWRMQVHERRRAVRDRRQLRVQVLLASQGRAAGPWRREGRQVLQCSLRRRLQLVLDWCLHHPNRQLVRPATGNFACSAD